MTKNSAVLSPREIAVVHLTIDGNTYQDIADKLGLRHESVKTYMARIREKLGVSTKVEIAVWGLKHLEQKHVRIVPTTVGR